MRPGAKLSAVELEAYVAERIAEPPARPRYVYLQDELPMTAVGKVFKPALRRDATRRVVEVALADLAEACGGLSIEIATRREGGFEALVCFRGPENLESRAVVEEVSARLKGHTFGHRVRFGS